MNADNVAHVLQLPSERAELALERISRVSIDGEGVLVPAGRTHGQWMCYRLAGAVGDLMSTGSLVASR